MNVSLMPQRLQHIQTLPFILVAFLVSKKNVLAFVGEEKKKTSAITVYRKLIGLTAAAVRIFHVLSVATTFLVLDYVKFNDVLAVAIASKQNIAHQPEAPTNICYLLQVTLTAVNNFSISMNVVLACSDSMKSNRKLIACTLSVDFTFS